jgi:hypothetical protein
MLVVVMTALFTDSFLYGMLVPLTPELNATEDEAGLAVMYGGYALGLMLATPVLGVLSVPVLALGRHPAAAAAGADEPVPSVLAETSGEKS